jgi:hypothetical protein
VDKRSAVHQGRRGIRWTALSLVHPTAVTMIKARGAILLLSDTAPSWPDQSRDE